MTERYFEKFPVISYNGSLAVNITERTTLLNGVYNNPTLYYQYDIKHNERPDNIADRYYQDEYMGWILLMTNKVIDPYFDWYLDPDTFKNFIIKKYGTYNNALNKTKFYRNNWYSDTSPISTSTFNGLDSFQRSYYAPVYPDEYTTTPIYYSRKSIDWTLSTNGVAQYNVANGSPFVIDEIVNVRFNANSTGSGQVMASTSNTVTIQHLNGVTTTGTISGSSYLYGTESAANQIFTSATSLANNIGTTETPYWSAVSYLDYENEINEKNKSIRILDNKFSVQISTELKSLLE